MNRQYYTKKPAPKSKKKTLPGYGKGF